MFVLLASFLLAGRIGWEADGRTVRWGVAVFSEDSRCENLQRRAASRCKAAGLAGLRAEVTASCRTAPPARLLERRRGLLQISLWLMLQKLRTLSGMTLNGFARARGIPHTRYHLEQTPHWARRAPAPADKRWSSQAQRVREGWMPLMSYLEQALFYCSGDHVHHSVCSPYLEDTHTHTHTVAGIEAQKSIWEGRWMVCFPLWDLRVCSRCLSLFIGTHTHTHTRLYTPFHTQITLSLFVSLFCTSGMKDLLSYKALLTQDVFIFPLIWVSLPRRCTHVHAITWRWVMKAKRNHVPHTRFERACLWEWGTSLACVACGTCSLFFFLPFFFFLLCSHSFLASCLVSVSPEKLNLKENSPAESLLFIRI